MVDTPSPENPGTVPLFENDTIALFISRLTQYSTCTIRFSQTKKRDIYCVSAKLAHLGRSLTANQGSTQLKHLVFFG